jgi:hypothetical protein
VAVELFAAEQALEEELAALRKEAATLRQHPPTHTTTASSTQATCGVCGAALVSAVASAGNVTGVSDLLPCRHPRGLFLCVDCQAHVHHCTVCGREA